MPHILSLFIMAAYTVADPWKLVARISPNREATSPIPIVIQGMTTPWESPEATVTATMLEAGISRNITPPVARAVLDIRSTPDWSHDELANALRASLACDVIVTSNRLVPCETPPGSHLLATASRVRPAAKHFGSPTCSDWVFFRDRDAIKCGPGTSRRSHTADEYVDIPEVTAARSFYGELIRAYLAGR